MKFLVEDLRSTIKQILKCSKKFVKLKTSYSLQTEKKFGVFAFPDPRPQFVFDSLGPKFVFHGLGP